MRDPAIFLPCLATPYLLNLCGWAAAVCNLGKRETRGGWRPPGLCAMSHRSGLMPHALPCPPACLEQPPASALPACFYTPACAMGSLGNRYAGSASGARHPGAAAWVARRPGGCTARRDAPCKLAARQPAVGTRASAQRCNCMPQCLMSVGPTTCAVMRQRGSTRAGATAAAGRTPDAAQRSRGARAASCHPTPLFSTPFISSAPHLSSGVLRGRAEGPTAELCLGRAFAPHEMAAALAGCCPPAALCQPVTQQRQQGATAGAVAGFARPAPRPPAPQPAPAK